jgi:hypothetical protein
MRTDIIYPIYDPERHRVQTNLYLGALITAATGRIRVKKVDAGEAVPYIAEVVDVGALGTRTTRV